MVATAKKEPKNGRAKTSTSRVTKAKAKPPQQIFTIRPLNIRKMVFTLEGISPLVVHNFDQKTGNEMLEKQMNKDKSKVKEVRTPLAEYLASGHWVDPAEPPAPKSKGENGELIYDEKKVKQILRKAKFGFPLAGFGKALISAARNTDMKMTQLRQCIFVEGIEDDIFAIIQGQPEMHKSVVRLKNGTAMVRFRMKFQNWKTKVRVSYDANVMNGQTVVNLMQLAGWAVGVGEGRPEKTSRLGWGRWEIVQK